MLGQETRRAQVIAAVGADAGDVECTHLCGILGSCVHEYRKIHRQVRANVSYLLTSANAATGFALLAAACDDHFAMPASIAGVVTLAMGHHVYHDLHDRKAAQACIGLIACAVEERVADMASGNLMLRQDLADRGVEYASLSCPLKQDS